MDGSQGMFYEICGSELRGWINDVQQMMGDVFSLMEGGLIRADIESFVNLHRIAVDDFSMEFFRQEDGCGAFSDSGGS
jgi:hypothetical protein